MRGNMTREELESIRDRLRLELKDVEGELDIINRAHWATESSRIVIEYVGQCFERYPGGDVFFRILTLDLESRLIPMFQVIEIGAITEDFYVEVNGYYIDEVQKWFKLTTEEFNIKVDEALVNLKEYLKGE